MVVCFRVQSQHATQHAVIEGSMKKTSSTMQAEHTAQPSVLEPRRSFKPTKRRGDTLLHSAVIDR